MADPQDNLTAMWKAYQQDRCTRTRNRLVEHYLPSVHAIVRQMMRSLAEVADYDDLRSAGVVGLIEAVERFDPGRGVRFSTFSTLRIRGAIFDELREIDWLPRSARQRASRSYDVACTITAATGRKPSEDEVDAALGVRPGQYRKAHRAGSIQFKSLEGSDLNHDGEDRVDDASFIEESEADPAKRITASDEVEHLLAALPARQQRAMRLRYLDSMTFKEMGQALDIGTPGACNATRFALSKLRMTARLAA